MDQYQIQSNSSGKLQSILLAAAFLLFVLMLVWGIFRGAALGRDQATYKNLASIDSALRYYKNDQGRYPSEAQYSGQQILVPLYIAALPEPVNASGTCAGYPQFAYSQSSPQSFKVEFCLQRGAYGVSGGPHILTEKGIQ